MFNWFCKKKSCSTGSSVPKKDEAPKANFRVVDVDVELTISALKATLHLKDNSTRTWLVKGDVYSGEHEFVSLVSGDRSIAHYYYSRGERILPRSPEGLISRGGPYTCTPQAPHLVGDFFTYKNEEGESVTIATSEIKALVVTAPFDTDEKVIRTRQMLQPITDNKEIS